MNHGQCRSLFLRCSLATQQGLWLVVAVASLLAGPARGADEKTPVAAEAAKTAPAVGGGDGQRRIGLVITIPGKVTDRVEKRVRAVAYDFIQRAKQSGDWPVLIFEIHPGDATYGDAFDLATYIASPQLDGSTRVAYLPKSLSGHALLVAMACEQIAMDPDAEIGPAGLDGEVIGPAMRSGYTEVASAHKTVPVPLALGMLDRQLEVLEAQTGTGPEFVLTVDLEKLRREKDIQSKKVVKEADKPGRFTGLKARELGLVSYLAQDRQAVAKALGLSRETRVKDLALESDWRPKLVEIKGRLHDDLLAELQEQILTDVREHKTNFICLWIDSAGGSPRASLKLAQFLADDPDLKNVFTVAYGPNEARGDASLIALACNEVVLGPAAALGGIEKHPLDPAALRDALAAVDALAKSRGRPRSLLRALLDPNEQVFRYHRMPEDSEWHYSEAEAKEQPDFNQLRKDDAVTQPGHTLQTTGEDAIRLRLATLTAASFDDLREEYGLESAPGMEPPGWARTLIRALASPELAWVLLLVGFAALFAEIQMPGIGVGAIVAGICFLLFFWSKHLDASAGWLEVLLFLAGVACVLLEVFVIPGFGIFGLAGGAMIIVSLVLASQTFALPRDEYETDEFVESLLVVVGAGAGAIAVSMIMRRFLPKAPGFNRMVLAPPTGDELAELNRRESLARFDHLLDQRGVAITPLLPAGKARFGSEFVDVLTEGDLVDRGREVVVVSVQGNRVVVRQA